MSITLYIYLMITKVIIVTSFPKSKLDPLAVEAKVSDRQKLIKRVLLKGSFRKEPYYKNYASGGYDFDVSICKLLDFRVLCGYNKNKENISSINDVINMKNGCKLRNNIIECDYSPNFGENDYKKSLRNLIVDDITSDTEKQLNNLYDPLKEAAQKTNLESISESPSQEIVSVFNNPKIEKPSFSVYDIVKEISDDAIKNYYKLRSRDSKAKPTPIFKLLQKFSDKNRGIQTQLTSISPKYLQVKPASKLLNSCNGKPKQINTKILKSSLVDKLAIKLSENANDQIKQRKSEESTSLLTINVTDNPKIELLRTEEFESPAVKQFMKLLFNSNEKPGQLLLEDSISTLVKDVSDEDSTKPTLLVSSPSAYKLVRIVLDNVNNIPKELTTETTKSLLVKDVLNKIAKDKLQLVSKEINDNLVETSYVTDNNEKFRIPLLRLKRHNSKDTLQNLILLPSKDNLNRENLWNQDYFSHDDDTNSNSWIANKKSKHSGAEKKHILRTEDQLMIKKCVDKDNRIVCYDVQGL